MYEFEIFRSRVVFDALNFGQKCFRIRPLGGNFGVIGSHDDIGSFDDINSFGDMGTDRN